MWCGAPIIRIESALFVEKEFRNEYSYALAVRAYIEVAGPLHNGPYNSKTKTLEKLMADVNRLMAKCRPEKATPSGMFKGDGSNVMTLVESHDGRIPEIVTIYGNLSSYVHGSFEEQMLVRKISWLSELKEETNPTIASSETVAIRLRPVVFEDFDELLHITKPLREEHDTRQESDS